MSNQQPPQAQCMPCLNRIQEIENEIAAIKAVDVEKNRTSSFVRNSVFALLMLGVSQTGMLLWFLASDHVQQAQLSEQVADHEIRLRQAESTARLTKHP